MNPTVWRFEDLQEGIQARHQYRISPEIYESFLAMFADYSPIHVDDNLARRSGFTGKIMHGAILNGFLSHLVGMVIPGSRALLLSVEMRYLQPCYLDDALEFTATVSQRLESQSALVLIVDIQRLGDLTMVAKAKVHVKVRNE